MPDKIKILTFNLLVYKNLSTTDKSIVDKNTRQGQGYSNCIEIGIRK